MKALLALVTCAALAGCASSTPNYDARFGDAVRQARQAMVLNPDGSHPTAGLDGRAAREAMGRYHESFQKPPPVVNVINIGGQAGSGGSER